MAKAQNKVDKSDKKQSGKKFLNLKKQGTRTTPVQLLAKAMGKLS